MTSQEKLVPETNTWSEPYWEAAREEKLLLQKCSDCAKHIFYPRLLCPECFSDNIEWVEASGKGKVYTYTVVTNNAPSIFLKDMPYVIAIVRLDEGVQMLTNIVDCDHEKLACDMPVEVTYRKLNDEFTLPVFKPV